MSSEIRRSCSVITAIVTDSSTLLYTIGGREYCSDLNSLYGWWLTLWQGNRMNTASGDESRRRAPYGARKYAWDAVPGLRCACPGLFSCLPSGKTAAIGPVR